MFSKFPIVLPIFGILTFIILYIVATFLYPGGSNADNTEKGFNWLTNYWCDLSAPIAKNGEVNTSRPVAVAAMVVLCTSLSVFWYYLPALFDFKKSGRRIIRLSGISSMLAIVFLLFSTWHDAVINIAAFFGLIALIYTFVGLYKNNYPRVFSLGLVCMVLIAINNYVYYTHSFILYLPVIQKITFAVFFIWICLINWQMRIKEAT